MTEPAEGPYLDNTHIGEPAEGSTEVVYVKAEARKFRNVFNIFEAADDIRFCFYGSYAWTRGPGPVQDWTDEAYYISKEPLTHACTGIEIPAGTPFLLAELTEGKIMGDDELLPVGDYMRMICLDPRYPDSEKTLSFSWWHGVQEDQSGKFERVENDMTVLAIAATGLAL